MNEWMNKYKATSSVAAPQSPNQLSKGEELAFISSDWLTSAVEEHRST